MSSTATASTDLCRVQELFREFVAESIESTLQGKSNFAFTIISQHPIFTAEHFSANSISTRFALYLVHPDPSIYRILPSALQTFKSFPACAFSSVLSSSSAVVLSVSRSFATMKKSFHSLSNILDHGSAERLLWKHQAGCLNALWTLYY